MLDLQAYLLLASKDRDANVFREMLATEEFAAAIEVVAKPFVAALKRTYKVGGAQALSDLQKFLDQLIISASFSSFFSSSSPAYRRR